MKSQKLLRMMTVTGLVLAVGTPLLRAQTGSTTTPQRGQLSESDYRFVVKAARGGMEEVELGQIATQKGLNDNVRNFGQRMVTEHSRANDELKQIVGQKGAVLPATLSHGERSTLQDLQGVSGADFDKTYARDMVKDHKKDVKEFDSATKDLSDPDLRAWAQKTLPVLQEHLRMAQDMEASVKNSR
jgi:putative membrane protein